MFTALPLMNGSGSADTWQTACAQSYDVHSGQVFWQLLAGINTDRSTDPSPAGCPYRLHLDWPAGRGRSVGRSVYWNVDVDGRIRSDQRYASAPE